MCWDWDQDFSSPNSSCLNCRRSVSALQSTPNSSFAAEITWSQVLSLAFSTSRNSFYPLCFALSKTADLGGALTVILPQPCNWCSWYTWGAFLLMFLSCHSLCWAIVATRQGWPCVLRRWYLSAFLLCLLSFNSHGDDTFLKGPIQLRSVIIFLPCLKILT